MDEEAEEDQVQRNRGGSVVGAALGRCDGFAYGFDVGVSLYFEQDSKLLWDLMMIRRG